MTADGGGEVLEMMAREVSDHQNEEKSRIKRLTMVKKTTDFFSPVYFQRRFTGKMKKK